jgi:hypothetical protein
MSMHRPWTRYVYFCCHKFGQKNLTTTCRVRRYTGIPVIRSKNHGYEDIGLGFHQNTMTSHTRTNRHEVSCTHMTNTTIHRQNHLTCLLQVSVQLHFHDLWNTQRTCSSWKHQCLCTRLWGHVIQTLSPWTPGCPALYLTTHVLSQLSDLDISDRDDVFKKTKEFVGVPRINRYFTTENS